MTAMLATKTSSWMCVLCVCATCVCSVCVHRVCVRVCVHCVCICALCVCNPGSNEVDRRIDPWGSVATQTNLLTKFQATERDLVSKPKVDGSRGRFAGSSLWSPSLYVHKYMYMCLEQKPYILADIVVQEVALEPWPCVSWVPRFPLCSSWPVMQGIWAVVTASPCPAVGSAVWPYQRKEKDMVPTICLGPGLECSWQSEEVAK